MIEQARQQKGLGESRSAFIVWTAREMAEKINFGKPIKAYTTASKSKSTQQKASTVYVPAAVLGELEQAATRVCHSVGSFVQWAVLASVQRAS